MKKCFDWVAILLVLLMECKKEESIHVVVRTKRKSSSNLQQAKIQISTFHQTKICCTQIEI